MKKRWSIIFANSVPTEERALLTTELAERLKAVPDSYNNNAELRFSEGALPFTLTDVINVIPASKIRAVTLDTRHDGQQLKLQYGVNMMSTKGFLFEAEFDGKYPTDVQVTAFDDNVKMSENC
jgi:predicted dinucleotide-utilizing enzyme